jgi:hypothetical protein
MIYYLFKPFLLSKCLKLLLKNLSPPTLESNSPISPLKSQLALNLVIVFLGACPQTPWVGFAETWVRNSFLTFTSCKFNANSSLLSVTVVVLMNDFLVKEQTSQTPESSSPRFYSINNSRSGPKTTEHTRSWPITGVNCST